MIFILLKQLFFYQNIKKLYYKFLKLYIKNKWRILVGEALIRKLGEISNLSLNKSVWGEFSLFVVKMGELDLIVYIYIKKTYTFMWINIIIPDLHTKHTAGVTAF